MQFPSMEWEDLLEEGMATHSSVLAWRIPWRRSLVGYSPWGRKELDTTERLSTHACRDYPGEPVVKTPSFHFGDAGGVGLIPGQRTKIPHAAW